MSEQPIGIAVPAGIAEALRGPFVLLTLKSGDDGEPALVIQSGNGVDTGDDARKMIALAALLTIGPDPAGVFLDDVDQDDEQAPEVTP